MNAPLLGVDIGSVSVGLALLSPGGQILQTDYRFHRGMIRETAAAMLGALAPGDLAGVACTSCTPRLFKRARVYDSQACVIEAARKAHGRLGSLLVVGGERFVLLRFDSEGRFKNLKASTSCAAGTGSFLDQQAGRLGLSGSAGLGALAQGNRGEAPKIASRCAVFAKTDLCHAQQAGYSLEEICDGLCRGLARNIADTISTGEELALPAVFAGGVACNPAVVRHLASLLGCRFEVGKLPHLYGAIGAALCLLREQPGGGQAGKERGRPAELLDILEEPKSYYYQPLSLKLTDYPDFLAHDRRLFSPSVVPFSAPVEMDLYTTVGEGSRLDAVLGIDIGSTSTKAVLVDRTAEVLAGFYTRTAGQPLVAVQALLESLDSLLAERRAALRLTGVGTTGAGRKFIGKVIGADLILNEITAHARAACELDPEIDTIIEIGGQDSKFTTLRDGLVTFSQMNTVCAAGTGSFLEEQAAKLGVSLEEYSRRAEGVRAPLASDRCTVFMERDINHYLNRSYSVEEILAAALFSVRENYLLKVASEALIGEKVCFQGATAKNRALVAAFEQKLGKPLFVSRYCHLTGALGVALALLEQPPERSAFRGIELYRHKIPVRAETCELCSNHCRLRLAEVGGQIVAYGFLCGRDYDVKSYVSPDGSGFDPIREYRRAFAGAGGGQRRRSESGAVKHQGGACRHGQDREPAEVRAPGLTVGIPAALHLLEELPLWKRFFAELGIEVSTSEEYREGLKSGKEITGAEFCAPITSLHGHARHLAASCDAVFLPLYLEAPNEDRRRGALRYYCYYTQFAPSVVSLAGGSGPKSRYLLPLVDHGSLEPGGSILVRRARRRTKDELLRALQGLGGLSISYREVSRAYDRAVEFYRSGRVRLARLYGRNRSRNGDIEVVLAGRPYQVLDPEMNKAVPAIFSSLGVRTFYQDMLPAAAGALPEVPGEVKPLLDEFHWHYAVRILETATFCAAAEGLYPVLITAFKCSPDSFVIDYFKKILDARRKPYLILQIDEHESSVGYETRIEAAVHSFRNHSARNHSARSRKPATAAESRASGGGRLHSRIFTKQDARLDGKILLFPNWDRLTIPLVVANLRRAGVDARVLEEDELSIRRSARLNTGQCLPANAITQSMVDYIERQRLEPERTLLWMARSVWSCNIHLFPRYIAGLLEAYGGGMEKAGVYVGDLSHAEISPFLGVGAYFAYLFGGLLRRLGCRIRPYELNPGQTDRTIAAAQAIFLDAFLGKRSREAALAQAIEMFAAIPTRRGRLPKVAIFGDLYVRDNEVMNQELIRFIEQSGGEVVSTPYSEYLRIVADATFKKWAKERRYLLLARFRTLLALVKAAERRLLSPYRDYLGPTCFYRDRRPQATLASYNVRLEHHGESFDNLLKIAHLVKEHPDLCLFVQTNPAFCCPSLVTEAMAPKIEELTGVPVVTVTYDGTGSFKNDRIVPYLAEARRTGFRGSALRRPAAQADAGRERIKSPSSP